MARQRTFFHKCHRCIYRGKAANWEPEEAPLPMINVHAAEEPVKADIVKVKTPARRKQPAAAPASKDGAVKGAPAKTGAGKAATAKSANAVG